MPAGRAWNPPMEAEGVLPRDPDKSGEVFPAAACGERHRGTGSGGRALNNPLLPPGGPRSPRGTDCLVSRAPVAGIREAQKHCLYG